MSVVWGFVFVVIIIILVVWFCLWIRYGGKVEVVGNGNRPLQFLEGKSELTYYPHVLYGLLPKVNLTYAFKKNKNRFYRPVRELLTSRDGGIFGIDWFFSKKTDNENAASDTPILVVVHGLNGGSSESYVQKICLRVANELGWRVTCILFRGCCGTTLKTPSCYNGGFTEDLHVLLETLSVRYPSAPIRVLGYSLGGNMVTKYFGEQFSMNRPSYLFDHVKDKLPVPGNVIAAAAVCNPFDLLYMDNNIAPEVQRVVGEGLGRYIQKHRDILISAYPDIDKYLQLRDKRCRIFDTWITSKMFGYHSLEAFYIDLSSSRYLDGVGPHRSSSPSSSSSSPSIPVLFISALNDPLSLSGAIPRAAIAANPSTAAIVTKGGSHLGFFSPLDTSKLFDEDTVLRFFCYEVEKAKKAN